ncbi:hypothetical protein ACPCKL_34350 [Streptomyces cellulosae]
MLRTSKPASTSGCLIKEKPQVCPVLRSREAHLLSQGAPRSAHGAPATGTGGTLRFLRIASDTTVPELDLPEAGAHSTIQDRIGTTNAVGQGA